MKRFIAFCIICLLMPLVVFALPKHEPELRTVKQISIENEMVEVARDGTKSATALYQGGKLPLTSLLEFSAMVLEAELQQATTTEKKLAAIDAGIERATKLERMTHEKLLAGVESAAAHSAAKYHLLKMMRLREQVNTLR